MRYYGGGVGHVDPRGIEGAEVDPVEVGDEGQRPDDSADDVEEPDNEDDEGDDELDLGENSDEEDMEYVY